MSIPIGTCSECGGPVVVPMYSVHPIPHCERCGAIAKNPHGPVIPMETPFDYARVKSCDHLDCPLPGCGEKR